MAFGLLGEPSTLDPYSPEASPLTHALARPLYPSLFRFRPDGIAVPYLAERVETVPRGVRVVLRRARWSDGSPITADDVVASQQRAGPPSGFARVDAAADGPRAVRFHGAVSDWEQTLATAAYVLPGGRAEAEVSGGPFSIESSRPGSELVLRRNPDWFGDPAHLRRISIRFVDDVRIMLTLLEEGELDAAAVPSTVNLLERASLIGLEGSAALGWESIQLRAGERADPPIVASVAAALDRRLLRQTFIRMDGRITDAFAPGPGPEGAAGPWTPPRARSAFGRPISIGAPRGDELLALLQRAVQVQLEDLGQVDLVTSDVLTFYGAWARDAPVDMLLTRVLGTPGQPEVSVRGIPLFQVRTFLLWRPGISGLEPNPSLEGPLWNAETWRRERAGT